MTTGTFFHGMVNQLHVSHLQQGEKLLTGWLIGAGVQTESVGAIYFSTDDCNGHQRSSFPLFEGL